MGEPETFFMGPAFRRPLARTVKSKLHRREKSSRKKEKREGGVTRKRGRDRGPKSNRRTYRSKKGGRKNKDA